MDFASYLLNVERKRPLTVRNYAADVTKWRGSGKSPVEWCGEPGISDRRFLSRIDALAAWARYSGDPLVLPARVRLHRKIQPVLTVEQTTAILGALRSLRWREQAAIWLIYTSGARKDEICSAKLADLDLDKLTLKIEGKGGDERIVDFTPETAARLRWYIRTERAVPADGEADWLFTGKRGLKYDSREPVKAMRRAAGKLGLDKELGTRPVHILRRSCITHRIDLGQDVISLARQVGHTNINTTEGYVEMAESRRKKAYNQFQPLRTEQRESNQGVS